MEGRQLPAMLSEESGVAKLNKPKQTREGTIKRQCTPPGQAVGGEEHQVLR